MLGKSCPECGPCTLPAQLVPSANSPAGHGAVTPSSVLLWAGIWLRAATALASAALGIAAVLGGCKSRGASALVWFKEHQ